MIYRVGLLINGIEHYFLKLRTKDVDGDGTVNVSIKHAKNFTHGVRTSLMHGDFTHPPQSRPILGEYYSIHPSRGSPDDIMLFKHSLSFEPTPEDGSCSIVSFQKTKGVKNGNSVLVFGKLCQDLGHLNPGEKVSRYLLKSKKDLFINLGSYSPKGATIVYFLVVSPIGSDIGENNVKYKSTDSLQCKKIIFDDFIISIFYTFLTYQSTLESEISHQLSADPEDVPAVRPREELHVTTGYTTPQLSMVISGMIDKFIAVHCYKMFRLMLNMAGRDHNNIETSRIEIARQVFEKWFFKICKPSRKTGFSTPKYRKIKF